MVHDKETFDMCMKLREYIAEVIFVLIIDINIAMCSVKKIKCH